MFWQCLKGFSASYSVEWHFKRKIAQELFRRKFTHKCYRLSIVSKFNSIILGTGVPHYYHQLQVHQQARTQFYSAVQQTLMRSLKKRGGAALECGPWPVKWKFFHDLRGETVTSIITEKPATAGEKKTHMEHQEEKSWPTLSRYGDDKKGNKILTLKKREESTGK